MSVVICVSSLSSFYAEETCYEYQPLGPDSACLVPIESESDSEAEIAEPESIHDFIVGKWMPSIAREVSSRISVPIAWDESLDAQSFIEELGYDVMYALQLSAAYHEHPSLKKPDYLPEGNDEAFEKSTNPDFKSRFSQLFGPRFWLPIDFDFDFEATTPDGDKVWFGSSVALMRQLKILNDEIFKATERDLERWKSGEFEGENTDQFTLENRARWGFAVYSQLAKISVENKLPMYWDG